MNGDVENRSRIILSGNIARPDEPAVEKVERSFLDQDGLHEHSDLRFSYGICGHSLRTAQDMGGICVGCGLPVCSECSSQLICDRCGSVCCLRCGSRDRDRKSGEEKFYCPECYRGRAMQLLYTFFGLICIFAFIFFS